MRRRFGGIAERTFLLSNERLARLKADRPKYDVHCLQTESLGLGYQAYKTTTRQRSHREHMLQALQSKDGHATNVDRGEEHEELVAQIGFDGRRHLGHDKVCGRA